MSQSSISTPATLLQARGLAAWYGAAQILYDIDLDVKRGEVVALMGRNGAGKSTTLKALMGMLAKRRGQIEFLGHRRDERSSSNQRSAVSTVGGGGDGSSVHCCGQLGVVGFGLVGVGGRVGG